MTKRTLYECSHAKVKGRRICCEKGYCLSLKSDKGSLDIRRLARGEQLALGICQECPDFDSMGPPIPEEEKGWEQRKKIVRNPYGRKGKRVLDEQVVGKAL